MRRTAPFAPLGNACCDTTIDVHLEQVSCRPMETCRYYRRLDY